MTLQASDGSATASQTFTWTVEAAGTLTLANPGGQANDEGDSVSVSLSPTYSGGGTVYFAAYGLPSGLKISPTSGAITGTVALGDAAAALHGHGRGQRWQPQCSRTSTGASATP